MRAATTLICAAVAAAVGLSSGCSSVTPTDPSLPTPPTVARVTVEPDSADLVVGDSLSASALPQDSAGDVVSGQTVDWGSNNPSVATVTGSGSIEALSPGTAIITASAAHRSGMLRLTIRQKPVSSVRLSPTSADLITGATQQFSVSVLDKNGTPLTGRTVQWSSASTQVATISTSGLVTASATGTTTITASCEGKSATASITVTPPPAIPVATVMVSPGNATVSIGNTAQFGATTKDASGNTLTGRAVTWSSADPSVATVSTTGLVAAVSAGATTITALSEGKSGSASITVPAPTATLTQLVLSPSTSSLHPGATQQFTVSGTWSDGVSRAVSATFTATGGTISSSGLYTASNTIGGFSVIARQQGATRADTSTVTITAPPPTPVASVSVSPKPASVVAGATLQLTATTKDSSGNTLVGRTVSWSSANTDVGTISGSGLVTGVAAGTTTITATSEGVTGTTTLTVTAPSSGDRAHECASPKAGWIWCDDFEQDRSSSYFEYNTVSGSFARTSSVGLDGSSAMKAHFAAGQTDAGSIKVAFGQTPSSYFRPVDAGTAKYRELYWRLFLKNQSGWTGGGGDKLSRATVFAASDWSQAMIAHEWAGSSPNQNYLVLDPASGTDAAGNLVTSGYNDFAHLNWLGAAQSSTPIFDAAHVGQWYCIEAHVKLNDAGQSNGVLEVHINGNLEAQRTGLNFLGSFNAYGLNAVFVENFWNAGSPVAQDRYIDNFVVSTQSIGCP
jgi:uncharacterized protein YjdB